MAEDYRDVIERLVGQEGWCLDCGTAPDGKLVSRADKTDGEGEFIASFYRHGQKRGDSYVRGKTFEEAIMAAAKKAR